jgi:hypothetical protein
VQRIGGGATLGIECATTHHPTPPYNLICFTGEITKISSSGRWLSRNRKANEMPLTIYHSCTQEVTKTQEECCAHHPPDEIILSDVVPRWAVIGWLLTTFKRKNYVDVVL